MELTLVVGQALCHNNIPSENGSSGMVTQLYHSGTEAENRLPLSMSVLLRHSDHIHSAILIAFLNADKL